LLSIGGRTIQPEAITLQTVLPKCLGPYAQWESKLAFSALSGYNMIHFTPVQELGTSQSSYSIYDQLTLNSKLFPDGPEQNWKLLADLVQTLETKYNMLSMTDLVWNHTADNSPWLVEHPESAYNLENSPHLKAAFDFDEALMQFSKQVEGVSIDDEAGLDGIQPFCVFFYVFDTLQKLTAYVFPKAKLWEYFVIDVQSHVRDFRKVGRGHCYLMQITDSTIAGNR
jgi:glycogen debranching enzyme